VTERQHNDTTTTATPAPPPGAAAAPALGDPPRRVGRSLLGNLAVIALIAALWPVAPLLERNLNPYFFQIFLVVAINVILVTSLNLINGITGQFSLGHAGFMAIGAYAAGVVMKHYQATGAMEYVASAALPVFGGMLAAVTGLLIGIPTLRLRGDYLAVATLGLGEIIIILLTQQDTIGRFYVGGASGLHGIPGFPANTAAFWTGAWVIICVVAIWRIVHSATGRGYLAVREDEIAAAATGVDTTRYKVLAFVIGAFFAGVSGALLALVVGDLDPAGFGFMRSVEIVLMVVLGGSGSITGGIVAAVVLTLGLEWLRFLGPWRMVIYSLLLVIVILVRPEGLLGRRELWWTRRRLPTALGGARPATVPAANPPVP
jgi:branched-chain amino acid transport system permease protein